MNIKKKSKRTIILLLILIIVVVGGMLLYNYLSVFYSGDIKSEWLLTWNDENYVNTTFVGDIGRVVGIVPEGRFRLYSMEGDADNNFIIAESWGTRYRYVKDDYIIPIDGEITIVYVYLTKIDNKEFCNAIEHILNTDSETFEIENKNTNGKTNEMYIGYEGCPVATEPKGFIGVINNKWVYISADEFMDTKSEKNSITCNIFDDAYIPILEEYLSKNSSIYGK